MAKVKKSTRKFNQRSKKISNKLSSRKSGASAAIAKPNTKPSAFPNKRRKQNKPKITGQATKKQSREEKLVQDLLNKKDQEQGSTDDILDSFADSNIPEDDIADSGISNNEESDSESDDDIFEGIETEYQEKVEDLSETEEQDPPSTKTPKIEPKEVKKDEKKVSSNKKSQKKESEEENLALEIDNLKEQDPEFYKFMKENDPSALEFNMDEDLDQDDSDIEDDSLDSDSENENEDEDGESNDKTGQKGKSILITKADLAKWEKSLTSTSSLNTIKQVIIAFKSASASDSKSKSSSASQRKYVVHGEDEFHQLMMISVKQIPIAISTHIPLVNFQQSDTTQKLDSAKIRTMIESNKKWKPLKPYIKSYLSSILQTISKISDNTMLTFVLSQTTSIVQYFVCFPKLSRLFIRETLKLFGSKTVSDDVAIASLLALRRLVLTGSQSLVEMSLKGVYLTYVRNSNISGIHSLSRIQLMRNCGIELYEVGGQSIYQLSFIYIRQLAIHLRNAMQTKSKESYRVVYNWQFINSLKFWTELLATCCGDRADENPELCDLLEPLLYPLIQVIIGVAKLVPTSKFFPLRLHCTDMLIRLSGSTGIFIPTLPLLIGILNNSDFTQRKPLQSTSKHLDLGLYIKAPKQYEHTRLYLETVLDKVAEHIARVLSNSCTNIGFPDYVVPLIINLKRWKKRSGNKAFSKHSVLLSKLMEKINATSKIISTKRSDPKLVSFGPSNFAASSGFMATLDPDTMPIKTYTDSLLKVNSMQRSAIMAAINDSNENDSS
ncbi:hypothetical protein BB560_007104 [Smittium megazygosporum]|uniref:Nucleolar complex protein 2 n=1 Tax=Smittium megazygosporum TaxID=133381 RepID=A0A2T9XYU2_9FUNG|nr:hypothetical protein BB560_007104 [Smittium megazygosporum]